MNIYLTGYRGSGKTTVGRILAQNLHREFRDSDEQIVLKAGKSIKDIFADHGEKHFRDLESQVVAELAPLDLHVIALGGGALLRPQNLAAIRSTPHHMIYLRCEPAELLRRIQSDPLSSDNRPSLTKFGGSLEEITRLLGEREPIYNQAMTAEVNVTGLAPDAVVQRILRLL